jgi:tetratricopeptide (TPR) repeat protein
MRKFITALSSFFIIIGFSNCRSGLVTMTNACYKAIQNGKADNNAGNYNDALTQFDNVLKQCDAYDAKEQAYAGKAAAYNGLQQYQNALDAANAGLKIKSTSLDNLFEKANAELGLNMDADAKADLAKIADLTSKNRNISERATIYAKMASIDAKNEMYDDALNNINSAISLDNKNADLYIVQGDIYTTMGDYSSAQSSYDNALSNDAGAQKVWQAKLESEITSLQKRYGTQDAQQMANKISSNEKTLLCADIIKAKSNNVKNINIDLLKAAVCK